MRVNNALAMCQAIGKTWFGVLGWSILGAAVGATTAGLYGVLFGTLLGLSHGDPMLVVSSGLYFALHGAVAGALVGGYARMIDPEGAADLIGRSPRATGPRDAVVLRPNTFANLLIALRRFLRGRRRRAVLGSRNTP